MSVYDDVDREAWSDYLDNPPDDDRDYDAWVEDGMMEDIRFEDMPPDSMDEMYDGVPWVTRYVEDADFLPHYDPEDIPF